MATSKPRLDRRIVRSRNAILSAFERLLMEKPLADITVSAIAREANVDRKTFYVHFGTVDGLLDAIAVDVVEMIVDSVERTLASMDGDTNERALGAAATFFKTINEALCNNLVLNRQLIENIPLDDFMARLRVPLEHEIAERDLLPHGLKDEMFDYYLAFLLSGIIGIYRTWALSDGSVPIERVSEVANNLTLNGLSSLEVPRNQPWHGPKFFPERLPPERFLLISLTYSYSPLTSFLLRLGENRLALLDRIVQGPDIEERLLRQVVHLTVENPAEAVDRVLNVHHHAWHTRKLLSHSERL